MDKEEMMKELEEIRELQLEGTAREIPLKDFTKEKILAMVKGEMYALAQCALDNIDDFENKKDDLRTKDLLKTIIKRADLYDTVRELW